MLNSRRLWMGTTVAGGLVLALLFLASPADGQRKMRQPLPPPPGPQPTEPKKGDANSATHFSAIKLIENDKVQQYLDLAREYIAGKSWKNAVQALQAILDGREDLKGDFYVQVKRFDPRTGDEKIRWASAKYEANALLGSMSPEGLEVYEVDYGAEARRLLTEAKKKGDRDILADVAQRYMHTRAGIEANELLATTFLDRGQFFNAALRFERLLKANEARYKANDLTLFKAALAYRRAGDVKNADRIWERLEPRLRRAGGLRIGEDTIATNRLRQVLDEIPAAPTANPHDWVMVAGNLTRSAQAVGSPPLLDEVLWSRKTILDKNDDSGEVERGAEANTRIEAAIKATREMTPPVPVMPGFFPIAAGGKVIYRTYLGVTAVNVHEVRDNDGKVIAKPGDIEWKSTDFEASLAVLLSDLKMSGTVNNWLAVYGQSRFLNLLYENSAVGTLSTDHRLVYAVDDLAVPAPPRYLQQHVWNTPQVEDKIKPLVKGNSLQAFELETGKIAFRLGGTEPSKSDQGDSFFESHFLGVPLPVGGKLYVLNEKSDGQLRLFTIDVRSETRDGNTRYTPVVVPPVQVLGTVAEHHRVTHDIARRATTVHLAYGEGILVCPTNAGELLGVDLVSRTLAWAYPYRQTPPNPNSLVVGNPQFGGFQPPNNPTAMTYANWKVSPPVIADGKVVFTAPDSIAVHCINLRDGTPVWSVRQQDNDLFFAGVYDGKALIVGKNSIRAYSLAKGDHLWTLPTGDMPSGQGVASKNIYYLPLQKGEIVAIDLARGVIKAHNRAGVAGEAPGNLVFYEGTVLSQTVDKIVAYPQLTAKLDLASKAVTADPGNLQKLALRGELYLRDGQVQQAVDDLRAVWHKKPQGELQKRVRQQLYNAFTDLMQIDFKGARTKYLDEYRELCKVPDNPAEQEHREAQLLRILGQGLESEGDLVGAFKAYREFGSLPLYRNEGIPATDDPGQKIPSNVWLRGRVMNMLARATAEQRQPLEARIAEEWKTVEAKNDVEAVRSFVGMFDVPFQVGRAARLKLANLIIEKRDRPAFLEAELNLQQLLAPGLKDDPQVGGRALDALGRLEIARGTGESMRTAMTYYKELAAAFPQVGIRGKQTGEDLFRNLLADKRFLEYFSEGDVAWPKGEMKGRELTGRTATTVEGFLFDPRGEVSPALRQYRLALDAVSASNPTLRVLDMNTNQVRGEPISLGNVPLNYSFYQFLYRQAESNQAYYPNARFRYFHARGHLAVVQVGTVVYGIDLSTSKLLWQHKLLELNGPLFNNPQVTPDAEGNLWLTVFNPNGGQASRHAVGNIGAVEASYVALTTDKGLVLLDPLRGTPLWTKVGVRPQTEIFGDGEHLYLVNADSSGITGPSQVLRATDGSAVETKDFTNPYRHRLRVQGRILLVADPAAGLTLRLYDALTGKDLWKHAYPAGSVALHSEDPNLTGAIEPNGQIHVVDLRSQKEVLNANLIQSQITQEDLKQLHKPLLLADQERFYVALNAPVNASQVVGGVLSNNFRNGLRCSPVNGWFCALDRKTGAFLWHPLERTRNQMIVLEQFQRLPVLLFSVRYFENRQPVPGQPFMGARMVWSTIALDKKSGCAIYWPDPKQAQGNSAQFQSFAIDAKAATVNLIGYNNIVQLYVNDGRKRPEDAANGGGAQPVPPPNVAPQVPKGIAVPPGRPRPIRLPKGAALPRLRLEPVSDMQLPVIQRQRVVLPADR